MFRWTLHLSGAEWLSRHGNVAVGDEVYCFGDGYDDDTDRICVGIFNTVSLCWTTLPPGVPGTPSPRWGHSAVLVEDVIYLWGGYLIRSKYYHEYCNVLYEFNVNTRKWRKPKVSGSVPEERGQHSACVLGKVMFIHGGYAHVDVHFNDTYKLDTTEMVWSAINCGGPLSHCHSGTIIGKKMFVFGGYGGWGIDYNTIRVFDTETNDWMIPSSAQPEVRSLHSAFAYNGELFIFGGYNNRGQPSDLWKFNPRTFSWKKVGTRGKGPSKTDVVCCCMVGDRVVVVSEDGVDSTPGHGTNGDTNVLDFSPSLKTLCKLAAIQCALEHSELPHYVRWDDVGSRQVKTKKSTKRIIVHPLMHIVSHFLAKLKYCTAKLWLGR